MLDAERFTELVSELKKAKLIRSQKELAKIIGENEQGIIDLKSGKKKVRPEHLIALEKEFPEWDFQEHLSEEDKKALERRKKINAAMGVIEESELYYERKGGNPEMSNIITSNTGKHSTKIITSSGEYLKPVPYYRTVQSKTNSDNIEMTGEVIEYVYMRDLNDCDMMIVLHSNSMLGKYNPGQRLGLRRVYDLRLIEYGEVFYIRTREFNTVKYLWPVEDKEDVVKLVPANKEYPAYNIPKDLIDELYIVRYEGRPTVN